MQVADGHRLAHLVDVVDADHGAGDEVLTDGGEDDGAGDADGGHDGGHARHVDADRGKTGDGDHDDHDLRHEEQQLLAEAVVVDAPDEGLGDPQCSDSGDHDDQESSRCLRRRDGDLSHVDGAEDGHP